MNFPIVYTYFDGEKTVKVLINNRHELMQFMLKHK